MSPENRRAEACVWDDAIDVVKKRRREFAKGDSGLMSQAGALLALDQVLADLNAKPHRVAQGAPMTLAAAAQKLADILARVPLTEHSSGRVLLEINTVLPALNELREALKEAAEAPGLVEAARKLLAVHDDVSMSVGDVRAALEALRAALSSPQPEGTVEWREVTRTGGNAWCAYLDRRLMSVWPSGGAWSWAVASGGQGKEASLALAQEAAQAAARGGGK